PASYICQHYTEISNGLKYTFQDNSDPNNPNPACSSSEEYNDLELENFTPGYPTTPNTEINSLRQLQSFPIPRIKAGHDLMPNYSWIFPTDLSGTAIRRNCNPNNYNANNLPPPGTPYEPYLGTDPNLYRDMSYDFNAEMARNWNYYLTMEGGYDRETAPWTLRFNLRDYLLMLAANDSYDYHIKNENGNSIYSTSLDMFDYPMGMKTFWGSAVYEHPQVQDLVDIFTPGTSSVAAINAVIFPPNPLSLCVPDPTQRYLVGDMTYPYPCKKRPLFSPLHDDQPAQHDGNYIATNHVKTLLDILTDPNNTYGIEANKRSLDLISENGEQLNPLSCLEEHVYNDPNVQGHILNCFPPVGQALHDHVDDGESFSTCLGDPDCIEDLDRYISENYGFKFLDAYYQEFKSVLDNPNYLSVTNNAQAKFSMYYQGGQNHRKEHFLWESVRTASSPMGPEDTQYGTTSIYINPKTNFESSFNYRTEGFALLDAAREREISAGDKWCSPFVSPGYSGEEDRHISPAQWLGLLKVYSAMGSEFFYPGNFNTDWARNVCADMAYPNDYAYTITTPAYAQGITSRAMNLFRNGDLLLGTPTPDYFFDQNIKNSWERLNYNFETDKHNSLVVVRKLKKNKGTTQYLISGNLNRLGNKDDKNAEEEAVTIDLEGVSLSFNLRTQGSNFIFTKGLTANKSSFYQLDGWHEAKHPFYWSKAFHFEAELYDNPDEHFPIYTWRSQNAIAQGAYNYTDYTSFIKLNELGSTRGTEDDPVEYKFVPRALHGSQDYKVVIRARKKNASGKIWVKLQGQPQAVEELECNICSNNWKEYPDYCNTNSGFACASNGSPLIITPTNFEVENTLEVYAEGGEVHLDYIKLVPLALDGNRELNPIAQSVEMSLYPNPSASKTIIKINSGYAEQANLKILDFRGQSIYSQSLSLIEGEQQLAIPVSNLPNGMYLVQLQLNEEMITEKLQILR
ncbi:MAG: T9SS type A sorting domain-containing protein, partial [Bacteroidota bacterium]